ncbi:FecR family protein [Draconibacterium mangrovi]|uniref:FecR family protein n=1 Tax=Draconibacterium mangrovi TaxID=2697469 RepID=UPI0013D3E4E8|nr:FecR domain-containing protein [Draconibacterium mangrovi]
MLEENIHNLIIRLFSGEATTKEKASVRHWINESDENREMYSDLQEIWLATGDHNEYNTEKAILKFKDEIHQEQKKSYRIGEILKYAAIAVLLLSLPFIYYLGKQQNLTEPTFTTITCALGDKSTVTLPDGSLVYLNSGSELRFNNDFHQDYREVEIEGEAYFQVEKNKEIPFRVEAGDITVEVLGTEFNLKAYPEENTISTTLVEGSVQIKSASQQAIMKPNQKIVFDKESNKMTLHNLKDVDPETEWKEGRLVFRNESLGDLELKLERWFDVDIVFSDNEVKARRFTGILERESILEALAYFSISDKVGYNINNNEITFYTKN